MASLIGNGPSFPYNVSDSGGLAYVKDLDRINQSLFLILNTRKGDRLMVPDFGSDIHNYVFDPLDEVLIERLKYTIERSIAKWEPRISLNNIEFLTDESNVDNNILYISITYNIINTDVKGNFVYPYKRESYEEVYSNN